MSSRTDLPTRSDLRLLGGVLVAPVFIVLTVIAAAASPGYNVVEHQVSLLLIGPVGWLETAAFVLTGALALACATGLRTALRHGSGAAAAPFLAGAYGLLLILAGFFRPDAQQGFPRGAIEPTAVSGHANVHASAFSLLALAVVAFGLVLSRRFAGDGERSWAWCFRINSMLIVVMVVLGGVLAADHRGGLPLLLAAVCISATLSGAAAHLRRTPRASADCDSSARARVAATPNPTH